MDKEYYTEEDFFNFCRFMKDGLDKGNREYGYGGFVKNNVFKMMEEELRDLAVYAFLASRKLTLIREKFLEDAKGVNDETSAKAE